MSRNFLLMLCLILLTTHNVYSHGKETSESSDVISANWYEIESSVLQESRRYAVYLPPSYDADEGRHYPVLYVLDGTNAKIRGVSGMVESLSDFDLSRQLPEFVVVFIPNTNRSRDLTPTKANLTFRGQVLDTMIDNSGGATKFGTFLKQELFNDVETRFRVNEVRGIVGMSFGGLFAAHILLSDTEMFSHYLIADATYVWDDNYLNSALLEFKSNLVNKKANVFIGIANNDHLGALGIANREWGEDFTKSLEQIKNDHLIVSQKYFPEEQHGTVMFLAFYYGLIELFRDNEH